MKRLTFNIPLLVLLLSLTKCSTNVLPSKEKALTVINVPNKSYKLGVFYMPSNATIQSAIQVRKQFKDKEEIINTYERYNYMDTCSLLNDTTFMLVIRDTISVLGNKPDTVQIILN